ncbi:MAG: hypothetical protein Q4B48_01845 [Syntrophomonadaceae bacterium]|nr:hypothetical protein [Syntrophomonadaceae bacterium]
MSERRAFCVMLGFMLALALLLGHYAYRQLICGPQLAAAAREAQYRAVDCREEARGEIYDRHGFLFTSRETVTADGDAAPVIRRYGRDGLAAHVLGYLEGEAGSRSGAAGIEAEYDELLRDGGGAVTVYVAVDARGERMAAVGYQVREEAQKRDAVVLTLERRLQKRVESALDHHLLTGAAVVMDVQQREVWAMASRPSFDQCEAAQRYPERYVLGLHPEAEFKPPVEASALLDRARQAYPVAGTELSPLEACNLTASLVSGRWREPQLVSYTVDSAGEARYAMPEVWRDVTGVVGPAAAAALTAPAEASGDMALWGMTEKADGEPLHWALALVPAAQPRWAVAVLVEDAADGEERAAGAAREIAAALSGTGR